MISNALAYFESLFHSSLSSGYNSFHEGASCNEEETLSEQGQYCDEEQASPKAQMGSTYVNYQTYMKKTPSTRWSKQETELFYEVI